jgi:hypothetical protein
LRSSHRGERCRPGRKTKKNTVYAELSTVVRAVGGRYIKDQMLNAARHYQGGSLK